MRIVAEYFKASVKDCGETVLFYVRTAFSIGVYRIDHTLLDVTATEARGTTNGKKSVDHPLVTNFDARWNPRIMKTFSEQNWIALTDADVKWNHLQKVL